MLGGARGENGARLRLQNGRLVISAGAAASVFTGTVYLRGRKFTGLTDGTKPWVVVDIGAMTVTQSATPPPDPFPPGQEWYEKSKTAGDIHVTGFS
jgi:hypothetical protein